MKLHPFFVIIFITIIFSSCKSGPFNFIKPSSPHQVYERKLIDAGLDKTIMGTSWISKAKQSLQSAIPISLPYQEKGYFPADRVETAVFSFDLLRGQKLSIALDIKPVERFRLYADLMSIGDNGDIKLVAYADATAQNIEFSVDNEGKYLLRLQPELLSSGEYTVSLTTGPSLNFPVKAGRASQIQSLFGVGRDGNTRRHEGIDIFAPFRTPVIAVSNGRVTRVNENNLGGKVVWFRPEGKNYTLYYAHLDEQTVSDGQIVRYGDTLGRMGNTGNAKTTPPHLHFGIYAEAGAIDPYPFVNPTIKPAPEVASSTTVLNTSMRTNSKTSIQPAGEEQLESGTLVRVTAASENNYRIELPDGRSGYLSSKRLSSISSPLKNAKIKSHQLEVFDNPDSLAAVKSQLKIGESVAIKGSFGDFQFIEGNNKTSGWIKK